MRVATRPLDQTAVAQANRATAARYAPQPQPGDPEYGAFRRDWMDAYVAAGGQAETRDTPKKKGDGVRDARGDSDKHKGPRGAVADCECPEPATPAPADAAPVATPKPKAKPPAPKNDACTCKVTALNVSCGHGRKAKDKLLMVVSDNALGDKVLVAPDASGDCATALVVRADGKPDYPAKGPKQTDFRAAGPSGAAYGVTRLWKARPTTTLVSAEACGGAADTVKVLAYPSQKAALKVDLKEMQEKYKGVLAYLPINRGGQRAPVRSLHAPGPANGEARWGVTMSAEAQWAEDGDSHLAYCEMSLNGGFDPLIGFAAAFPVYGVPIPPKLTNYIKAGIYLNLDIGLSVGAACAWAYWPDKDEVRWQSFKIEGKGFITAELAAELLVASPDVIQVKAAGKMEVNPKVWGEKIANKEPAIKANVEFKPLTVAVVVKLAWGLIEYERSWPIFSPMKTDDYLLYPPTTA